MSNTYRRYFKNKTVVLCLVLEFKINMAGSQEEMVLNRVENAGTHEDKLKLCLFLLLGLQI